MDKTDLPGYHAAAADAANDPTPGYEDHHRSSQGVPDFPRDIVFYRSAFPSLMLGTVLTLNSADLVPISYVSIMRHQHTISPNITGPQIQVHATSDVTSMIIADVKYNTTPSTDLTLYSRPRLGSASEAIHIKLSNQGALTTGTHSFTLPGDDGKEETFQWKHSGDPSIRALAAENHGRENYAQNNRGLKLVAGNGEIIAIYVGGTISLTLNPRLLAGKIRFIEGAGKMTRKDFRLIVLLSVLSMMERGRVQANKADSLIGTFCVVS